MLMRWPIEDERHSVPGVRIGGGSDTGEDLSKKVSRLASGWDQRLEGCDTRGKPEGSKRL